MKKINIVNPGVLAGLIISLLVAIASCLPTEGAPPAEGDQGILGGSLPMIIFIVLIIVMMYFTMMRPQRKQQKERQEMMAQLRTGDKVITAAGIFGVIDSISEDSVVLKLESGATMRVTKNSVVAKRDTGNTAVARK